MGFEQCYKKMEILEVTNENDHALRCRANEIAISKCSKVLVKQQVYSESQIQNDFGPKRPIIEDF